jgi:lipid-binding SYLF domain-containing protein
MMKKTYKLSKILLISHLVLFSTMNFCQAGLWDSVKSVATDVSDAVTDTASKVGDTASDMVEDDVSPAQERQTIDDNAQKALSRLFKESKEAKEYYDKSEGYAVFDSREFAFLIKTGFGAGVAVNKLNNSRTYMKMAGAGANIGGGIKYMQIIFIFPTEVALNAFINDGWSADADASAVGGDDSGQLGLTLADGTKVYELVDTGIMAKMSIGGTKYWKDDDLN